uniref:DPPIV_N domain-containing protein n=1 Tax=Steinernema glaseri TaxID=37863 RepID=A0A1I7XXD0_9BILA
MKLTKVNFPKGLNPNSCFAVKDGWLFYRLADEWGWEYRLYNLSTGEEKPFVTGLEGRALWMFCVDGRLHVVYHLPDPKFNTYFTYCVVELDFDEGNIESAKVVRKKSWQQG